MKKQKIFYYWLLGSFLLLFLGSILTLVNGETPWEKVWEGFILRLQGKSNLWNPLMDERFPRLIVLVCTGASLAVSGAVMQSMFHNPLASPSVLGISSGGCLSVILIFIFDLRFTYPYALPLAAFAGCFVTLCLVYSLSRFAGREAPHQFNPYGNCYLHFAYSHTGAALVCIETTVGN